MTDGPRPIRETELPSLRRLLNRTFRAGRSEDMVEQFPSLGDENNRRRSIVIAEDGELVSHVFSVVRTAVVEGTPLTLALVGAVATDERCRGRGYATQCLNAALQASIEDGAEIAWISGGGGLYTTRGAALVGRSWRYLVERGEDLRDLDVREMTPADLPAAMSLYRREPVRFLRTLEDWADGLRTRWIMDCASRFWGVWRGPEMAAYLVMNEQRLPDSTPMLAEFAGERAAAVAAMPAVLRKMDIARAEVFVDDSDAGGKAAFARVSESPKLKTVVGTCLPLCIPAILERLRPRFAECLGRETAFALRFSETGPGPLIPAGAADRATISLGPEQVEIAGRANFARFLFGAAECPVAATGVPHLLDVLHAALPLPAPWYGLNFV